MATLAQVLRPITETFAATAFPDLLVGLEGPDDAAVYRLTDEIAIVQTVDFFPPVVDDPWQYGGIAAANAMSDVYAMGGEVLLALNIAAFPEDLDPAAIARVFHGGAQKVAEAGGVIAGGHTLYDAEPKYGLAVTGVVHPDRVIAKAGARAGDALVLTKPLGTGIVLTAAREDRDPAGHAAAAVASMLTLNRHASHLAREAGAHAMTDVTGFGLLGHASEVAARSDVRIVIDAARVPALPGALAYAAQGIVTGGAARNRDGLADRVRLPVRLDAAVAHLLFDPQTSGGLLVALAPPAARAMVRRLHDDGLPGAVVGRVEAGTGVVVE
ncbi:MAG: selenide, water dikinase SelD [Chloroflexota bacterium]|nr:selenide, water dikinase SelD [Chloroflexota bacterium]